MYRATAVRSSKIEDFEHGTTLDGSMPVPHWLQSRQLADDMLTGQAGEM
jgi:hypothetical protein